MSTTPDIVYCSMIVWSHGRCHVSKQIIKLLQYVRNIGFCDCLAHFCHGQVFVERNHLLVTYTLVVHPSRSVIAIWKGCPLWVCGRLVPASQIAHSLDGCIIRSALRRCCILTRRIFFRAFNRLCPCHVINCARRVRGTWIWFSMRTFNLMVCIFCLPSALGPSLNVNAATCVVFIIVNASTNSWANSTADLRVVWDTIKTANRLARGCRWRGFANGSTRNAR